MPSLDALIHQPIRLQIMAILSALEKGEQVNFTHLRDVLKVSDGNLGAHLLKLEEAEYIIQEKTYVSRKPCTFISATAHGVAAFEGHVSALKQLLGDYDKPRKKGT